MVTANQIREMVAREEAERSKYNPQEELRKFKQREKSNREERKILKETKQNIRRDRIERIKRPFKQVNQSIKDYKPSKTPGKVFKAVKSSIKYNKKLSNTLLAYANAGGNQVVRGQGASKRPVGRPRGSLKHLSPFTGQPIDAVEFYRQMREFRRLQSQKADQVNEVRQRQFAQQGVPPRQIQNVVEQRMRQQFMQQQPQMPQNYPQRQPQYSRPPIVNTNQIPVRQLPNGTIVPKGTDVWKWRRGVVGQEGGLFGPVKKVYGLPESFFN